MILVTGQTFQIWGCDFDSYTKSEGWETSGLCKENRDIGINLPDGGIEPPVPAVHNPA